MGKLSQCNILAQAFAMVMHGIKKGKEGKMKQR